MADITALKGKIPEEMYKTLDEALKDDKGKLADLTTGQYVDKLKYDALAKTAEDSKKMLEEANGKIEEFKGMDVESIKKEAAEYKTKYETAVETAKKEFETLKFDNALKTALSDAKAKNSAAVMALVTRDDLKLTQDGKILGLDEQLTKLKETDSYLFESKETEPQFIKNTGGETKPIESNSLRSSMGLPQL
jgi:hypothetical protein